MLLIAQPCGGWAGITAPCPFKTSIFLSVQFPWGEVLFQRLSLFSFVLFIRASRAGRSPERFARMTADPALRVGSLLAHVLAKAC